MGMNIQVQNQRYNTFFLIKYFFNFIPRFHVFLLKWLKDIEKTKRYIYLYIIIADTALSKQCYLNMNHSTVL